MPEPFAIIYTYTTVITTNIYFFFFFFFALSIFVVVSTWSIDTMLYVV